MTGCSGREPGINRNMISGLASAGAGGTRRCRRFWTGGSRDTVYSWQGKRTGWSAVDKSAGTWDGNRNHVSWRRALYFRVRRWKWWRNRLGIVWGLVCKIIQNKGRHNRYFFFHFFWRFCVCNLYSSTADTPFPNVEAKRSAGGESESVRRNLGSDPIQPHTGRYLEVLCLYSVDHQWCFLILYWGGT